MKTRPACLNRSSHLCQPCRRSAWLWRAAVQLGWAVLLAATDAIAAQPNLTYYHVAYPTVWSGPIVVSKNTGDNSDDTPLYNTDTLYVDWAAANFGDAATAATFYIDLELDGVLKARWYVDPPLNAPVYVPLLDYNLGSLAPGPHTLTLIVDSTGVIAESDEGDNEYIRNFEVAASQADIRVNPTTLVFGEAGGVARPEGQSQLVETSNDPPDYRVRLKTGEVNPETTGAGGSPTPITLGSPDRPGHFLVQFQRILSPAEHIALAERGLTLLQYIPNRAYWVAASPGGQAALPTAQEGGGVRWAMEATRIDRLDPAARAGQFPEGLTQPDGRVEINVLFFADVERATATLAVLAAVGESLTWDGQRLARLSVMPDRVADLAALDEVEWVELAPGPKTEYNAVAAQRNHVGTLRITPLDLDGAPVTVGVWDGGKAGSHTDFGTRLTVVDTGASVSDHATHVAGTIGGSGAGNAAARGMAPGVQLRSYFWDFDTTEMRSSLSDGVRLSNHSYGFGTGWQWTGTAWADYGAAGFGDYSSTTAEWDDVIHDTDLIVFKAAGNDRDDGPDWPVGPRMDGPYDTLDEVASGKNMITVGGTTDADGMTIFSSWGPVDDGRVKPDLCANGDTLYSTLPNNAYGSMSGTSMASPGACGAGALLFQLHEQVMGEDLRPDTCKALLIHGAKDLGRTGPDYEYGWGLIHALNSAQLLQNQQFRLGSVDNSGQMLFQVPVPSGAAALKVTVVWTDPAGSPSSAQALVNNLDLEVTSPSSATTYPWKLDGANPTAPATRGVNTVDNVEQVVVDAPQAGTWTIKVTGTAVTGGSPQAFTVVCDSFPNPGTTGLFTISNDGGTSLSITSMGLETPPADFLGWSSPVAPFDVALLESQTVKVTVDLESAPLGTTTPRILVASSDADESPYPNAVHVVVNKFVPEIAVSGGASVDIPNGATPPDTDNDTDFGYTPVLGGEVVHTFTVENEGNATLTLGTVSVTGSHAGDFTVTTQPSATVTAGNSTTFDITFNPSGSGLCSATVSFSDNDGDEDPFSFDIQGTGVDYTITTGADSITIIDDAGNSDTLEMTEPSVGTVQFEAAGRLFRVNDDPPTWDNSGPLSLENIGTITVYAEGGDDTVPVGAFTGLLPELTIDGGDGTDVVSLGSGATVIVIDADGFELAGSAVTTLLVADADGPVIQTGAIEGTGGLRKNGAGMLTLSLPNSYSGDTTVSFGTLALAHDSHNNVPASTVLLIEVDATLDVTGLTDERLELASGQTLMGSGTFVGTLGVSEGATLAPGSSPGILKSQDVTFSSGSFFDVEINGTAVGTEYDQLDVEGTVDLGGATLQVSGTYPPVAGDTFVIIKNDLTDPIVGTFDGLIEGATVSFNSVNLKISYIGGDGNDVTLQRPSQPTAAGLAYFRAIPIGPDGVSLGWSTLVEVGTLGFHLDRAAGEGAWERVTVLLIPAQGADLRPQTYGYLDQEAPATAGRRYRLMEVDLGGRERVLAEAQVPLAVTAEVQRSGSGLTVLFRGQPGTEITVETASMVTGPWILLEAIELDGEGKASMLLDLTDTAEAGFYRWY